MLVEFTEEDLKKKHIDFSVITNVLEKIDDENFVKEHCLTLLVAVFDQIKVKNWTQLLQSYKESLFAPVFAEVGRSGNVNTTTHLFEILESIQSAKIIPSFLEAQIKQLPEYLSSVEFHKIKDDRYYYYGEAKPTREKTIRDYYYSGSGLQSIKGEGSKMDG